MGPCGIREFGASISMISLRFIRAAMIGDTPSSSVTSVSPWLNTQTTEEPNMSEFKSCKGKNECRDDGVNCLVCGRSLEEVAHTQQLVQGLTDLALAKGYENIDDFADYVARRKAEMPDAFT